MPDRRQRGCSTADEIARAKVGAIRVRDGDPPIEDVLRIILANLQKRFGDDAKGAALVVDEDGGSTAGAPEETELAHNESLEQLTDVERACLEAMREDFDRGIVRIDDNANKAAYEAALGKNKTAGQSWEAIQGKLLANGAALMKKAVELSRLTGNQEGRGALLVGVYENGDLAIRQRSQEIVNARWAKDWQDGQSERGELRLLFHPEAMAQEKGRWAKAVEILRAVKAAGYHVPADDTGKKGLVAASEAVTGENYVTSPNRDEWRDAMLECFDNVDDKEPVHIVVTRPRTYRATCVYSRSAGMRRSCRGAVLWLRG